MLRNGVVVVGLIKWLHPTRLVTERRLSPICISSIPGALWAAPDFGTWEWFERLTNSRYCKTIPGPLFSIDRCILVFLWSMIMSTWGISRYKSLCHLRRYPFPYV